MPLSLELKISKDGNAQTIEMMKLFQVFFINDFAARRGGTVRIYTGLVFRGSSDPTRDAPAITIEVGSESADLIECTDITADFAVQEEPLRTYWGAASGSVHDANSLRSRITTLCSQLQNVRADGLLDISRELRKPILNLGDSGDDTNLLLAFPGDVDCAGKTIGRVKHYGTIVSEFQNAISQFPCYAWMRHDLKYTRNVTRLAGLDFDLTINFDVNSVCPDVSHYIVADRRLRIRRNNCVLYSSEHEQNHYFGGGAKEIAVQDKTPYFLEWIRQRVRDSSIFEIKDKRWFQHRITRQMKVDLELEDEIFAKYVINRITGIGIFIAALATIGLDYTRVSKLKSFFVLPLGSLNVLSETGVWLLMSIATGLAFLGRFSPASTRLTRVLEIFSVIIYLAYTTLAFFISEELHPLIEARYHWLISITPLVCIVSGAVSFLLVQRGYFIRTMQTGKDVLARSWSSIKLYSKSLWSNVTASR